MLNINSVIRRLILSDVALLFSFGLLSPIFAIFIIENINGGTLEVVGLAASAYWIARVITTIPLSRLMDRTDGEIDEYWFMVIGSYVMSFVTLFYILSTQPWHLYVIGFINGLANSMAVPGWRIIFTNHIDRGHTGYEWSMEDVGVGISIAVSAYIGAILADRLGFNFLFIMITIVGVTGVTVFLVPIKKYMKSLKQLKLERNKNGSAPAKVDTIK